MTALREKEIERRLEQSKRLLRGAADPTTTERIGKMIGELEHEIRRLSWRPLCHLPAAKPILRLVAADCDRLKESRINATPAFRLAGRLCVRKRGKVAYCTALTPRQAFGRPYPRGATEAVLRVCRRRSGTYIKFRILASAPENPVVASRPRRAPARRILIEQPPPARSPRGRGFPFTVATPTGKQFVAKKRPEHCG
jgi:hypothetical protein